MEKVKDMEKLREQFYEELQAHKKFESYARKLANKYFIESWDEDLRHFKARLLSICFDKAESYRINKKSDYGQMLEILRDEKNHLHKNLMNYILINSFHKVEQEEAEYQGKVNVGGEWVESPIFYTDQIESGTEDEIKYESVYQAPATIDRDDVTVALDIASKFLRKDQLKFVIDVFSMEIDDVLEKYNYPSQSYVNKRIKKISDKLNGKRREINQMIKTKQQIKDDNDLKVLNECYEAFMKGEDDRAFGAALIQYKDNDVISNILSDNVKNVNAFLIQCEMGKINDRDACAVYDALFKKKFELEYKPFFEYKEEKTSAWTVDLDVLKKNQERRKKYKEWVKASDVVVWDLKTGKKLRIEDKNGKVKKVFDETEEAM
ncbi:UNVERIFIED_ORG: hypothetical protein ABRZ91_001786 [Heyndrickxia coagulans]